MKDLWKYVRDYVQATRRLCPGCNKPLPVWWSAPLTALWNYRASEWSFDWHKPFTWWHNEVTCRPWSLTRRVETWLVNRCVARNGFFHDRERK